LLEWGQIVGTAPPSPGVDSNAVSASSPPIVVAAENTASPLASVDFFNLVIGRTIEPIA
jgi:hypothetical protein